MVKDYYCKCSHSIRDGVTKIGVTIRSERFRADDIRIKTYRPERAAIRALEKYLVTEKA